MKIPIVGGAYEGRSKNLNAQMCQNLFPVVDQVGGKEPSALLGTPGLIEFANPSYAQPVRACVAFSATVAYCIIGNRAYSVTPAGVLTQLTGTLRTTTGPVIMVTNGPSGSYVMLVDVTEQTGWYINTTGTTMTQITDTDFPAVTSLTFQDTYFIVTKADSDSWYISGSDNPTTWDALDYTSAEGAPDFAGACLSSQRETWVMGDASTEVYYNSGDATFPLERIPGSFNEIGIGAYQSLAKIDNTLLWLGNNFSVYRSEGYRAVPISTEQLDYQIALLTTKSDALAYAYRQEGHSFYVLTFPTADKTFVYDLSTQIWHTRASGVNNNRHPGNCYMFFGGKHIIGHHQNGKLLYYSLDTYTDNGEVLIAKRRISAVHQSRKLVFHNILEIEFEAGVGLDGTGQGTDPECMLRWSDDGGHTWGNQHTAYIGKLGVYGNRARFKKLGKSRARIYEVAISDPVKRVILSAELEASLGMT